MHIDRLYKVKRMRCGVKVVRDVYISIDEFVLQLRQSLVNASIPDFLWSLFGSCCCLYDVRFLVGLNALKKAVKSVDVGMRIVHLFVDLRVPSFSDVVGPRSGVVEMIPKLHICSFKPLLCHIVSESDDVYVDFLGVLLGAEPNTFYCINRCKGQGCGTSH